MRRALSKYCTVYQTQHCYVTSCRKRCQVKLHECLQLSAPQSLQEAPLNSVKWFKYCLCSVVHCCRPVLQVSKKLTFVDIHQLGVVDNG